MRASSSITEQKKNDYLSVVFFNAPIDFVKHPPKIYNPDYLRITIRRGIEIDEGCRT